MKKESLIKLVAVAIVLAFLGTGTYLYAGESNLEPIEQAGIVLDGGAKSGLAVLPHTAYLLDPQELPDIPKPKISDLNDHVNTFNGTITGIDAGAGLTKLTKDTIAEYNLNLTLMLSSEAGMLAALDAASKSKEHIVVTIWDPHWATGFYEMVYLEDDKGTYGEAESIESWARAGLMNEDLALAGIMERYEYTSVEFSGLLDYIEDSNEDISAATKQWLDNNPVLLEKWIGDLEREDRGKIKIGLVGWACAMGTSNVLKHVLESVGYSVTLTIIDTGVMFAGLAYGIIDLTTTVWMPLTHMQYLEGYA
jgi:glycine betaine/proline transport system substrate-binding protein